jgi:hypothetical protein
VTNRRNECYRLIGTIISKIVQQHRSFFGMTFRLFSRVLIFAILVCVAQRAHSRSWADGHLVQQRNSTLTVAVPDEATAVKIAEKALAKVYGKKHIESERPFKAVLLKGIWHVGGTLYCKDEHGNVLTNVCAGGVAMAEVRQKDGRVLRTTHTK